MYYYSNYSVNKSNLIDPYNRTKERSLVTLIVSECILWFIQKLDLHFLMGMECLPTSLFQKSQSA